jgi:hypothetical protein
MEAVSTFALLDLLGLRNWIVVNQNYYVPRGCKARERACKARDCRDRVERSGPEIVPALVHVLTQAMYSLPNPPSEADDSRGGVIAELRRLFTHPRA